MDDIPWKMIIMVGGAVLAIAVVALITAYVNGHLASIPN